MGWLGLDDTDTLTQGCTTFSLHELISHLPPHITVGQVRLVRLWPFAQQRTRGNAAVAVELTTDDEVELLQFLDSYWEEHLAPLVGLKEPSTQQKRQQSPTDPGMVWFSNPCQDPEYYHAAVSRQVKLKEVPSATKSWGGLGQIGATAAVLWPQTRHTWEAIAWREEHRWPSTERDVCQAAIAEVADAEDLFLTRDPRSKRSLISPRGTCPVLFGLRATSQEAAHRAAQHLLDAKATEEVIAMRVFITNQATDDHLDGSLQVLVSGVKILGRGTTIIETEQTKLFAFAESGPVKLLAQSLKKGDRIEVKGLAPESGVVHIEKMRVTGRASSKHRPMCTTCNKRMKSMGQAQGVRCPVCKKRQDDAWTVTPADQSSGPWVQPPMDSRRHLARPIEWEIEPQ